MSQLRPIRRLPLSSRASQAAAPLVGAAVFAAAEVAAALVIARFFEWARAEALLFLAFRPWLLVVSAVLVGEWSVHRRFAFYATALLLAGGCETILLVSLGAASPWSELLRGVAGGAALALAADLAVRVGRRWRPRIGAALAAAALIALFVAGALRPYEALVLGRTGPLEQPAPKPALLLLTALPIVWGSGGAFDPGSRPSESYRLLEREFDVRPIDAIDPTALVGVQLMLLAQPRLLAPEELVRLDDWVRRGGRLLGLTDPRLSWANDLPPGDARRPPQSGLLAPLLAHWGIRLGEDGRASAAVHFLPSEAGARRLLLRTPGRFTVVGPSCRVRESWLARCAIGRGRAVLVADADLLDDRTWSSGPDPGGSERHRRVADNPLIVADWLDGLAGVVRARADGPVTWIGPGAGPIRALILAALPLAIVLALGLGLLCNGRGLPTNLSTGLSNANDSRTDDLEDS